MTDRRQIIKLAAACVLTGSRPVASIAAPATKANKLVFVHGRSQQGKDPVALQAEWLDALKRGARAANKKFPANIEIAFPYYGDTLDQFSKDFAVPLTTDVHARGTAIDDEIGRAHV